MQVFDQAPFPPGAPPWETLPPQVVLIVALAVVAGAVLIFGPLLKAIARRIEGSGAKQTRAELASLNERLEAIEREAITSGEHDASIQRLYDVEERIDFVERVLSQGEEASTK